MKGYIAFVKKEFVENPHTRLCSIQADFYKHPVYWRDCSPVLCFKCCKTVICL